MNPFVVGNWKMNLSLEEASTLAMDLRQGLEGVDGVEVGVCPPFVWLPGVCFVLMGTKIRVGAQNMHWEKKGAFTGEVSGPMLKDVGCTHVLLGHSERRHLFGETDSMINKKLKTALSLGLKVIFCLGERLEEREGGETFTVVERQFTAGLEGVGQEALPELTIAYEPVWAIGTGKNATPEQAQEVHGHLRNLLENKYGNETASQVRIQYGGSVTPENAGELLAQPDINGLLVGGASLKKDSFLKIVFTTQERMRSPI
ncbi:MAG TPA: triose-phosphate isomerase [Candidatus Tripitaka californicus]|uniref:triose-phosphate isomerase n=1 Tax=Candidatus Tripitaka californicus TaxID=3367616 RepID=UPI004026997D|nr:triose-phosphate isomerase [Planctomycetota bacterium]